MGCILRTVITFVAASMMANMCVAADFRGEWIQGGVLFGSTEPGARIQFLERDVKVSDDGHFVIGLGRDAPTEVTVYETLPGADTATANTYSVKQREYAIQKIEGVPNKTVNPDPEQVARSRKEAEKAWLARQVDSSRQDYRQTFQWPLTGIITGVYGSQRYYNGVPRRPHFGVDVARPTGTVVVAPAAGKVTLTHDNMFFSGGTLIIDHGHGLSSTFIHLNKILVEEGQEVKQGDPIAEVGATGRVTGPHLDWRMNWFNQRVDPQLLVGDMPK